MTAALDLACTSPWEALLDAKASHARRNLIPFIEFTKPDYKAGWFHKLLAEYLEQFTLDVLAEKSPRLIIEVPPRHGKTEEASIRYPAWALGNHPDLTFIATSYGSDLAQLNNREIQRVIDSPEYRRVFPGTRLWGKNVRTEAYSTYLRNNDIFEIVGHKGVYKCAGCGGPITGKGGHIMLCDDPIKDSEEASSEVVRESRKEWWKTTFYSRQAPGAGIILIMCMTGDTRVMMADGSEKMLQDIRVGDEVATYENGRLATSAIRNWKNQGIDLTYEIKTISGIIVKANERHPFLVCRNEEPEWIRLRNLRVGDRIVSVRAPGAGCSALSKDVLSQRDAKACATRTMARTDGARGSRPNQVQHNIALHVCDTDTALSQKSSTLLSPSRVESAPYARSLLRQPTVERTGQISSVLTTTTLLERCEDYSATTAILPLGTARPNEFCLQPLSMYESTLDEIVSIEFAGCENVFDIEVDRTHNFIANGCVSSNTRWHQDDLAGWLLDRSKHGGEHYDEIRFPAIAEEDEYHPRTGELLRREGDSLHEQRYSLAMLNAIRQGTEDAPDCGSRTWVSLYQQRPSAIEGNFFKREKWQMLRPVSPVSEMSHSDRGAYLRELGIRSVIQSWDTALGEKQQNDFTACATLGIAKSRYYLLDIWKGQIEFPAVLRQIQLLYDKWKPNKVYVEGGGASGGKAAFQMSKAATPIPLFETKRDKDKVRRAEIISPHHESGLVTLFEGESWTSGFIDQCANFPNIKKDDDVDAFIGAMEEATAGHGPMTISNDFINRLQGLSMGMQR
jgi:predicted phage terminase large subunit-like protein